LRKNIKELEATLNPRPLFIEPLTMVILNNPLNNTGEVDSRTKKAFELLVGI